MDLSIIIVNFNTKQFTLDAIDSIYKSNTKASFEVIVVDNGSTDGSVEALKRNQKIKLIINKKNLGFSKANNIGMKISKGKHVLLLNSDTKIIDSAIDKLLKFANENSSVGAVVPRLVNSDDSIQPSVYRDTTITRAIKQFWLRSKKILDKYYPKSILPTRVEAAVMAAFLITPEAMRKVGGLNEKYFMYFEDLDYCRKLRQNNLKIYYLPTAKVIHYHGASGKHLADQKNQWKRLIPSSKIYHGLFKHYLLWFIMWTGQKLFKNK